MKMQQGILNNLLSMPVNRAQAHQRGLSRTLQALFREHLLAHDQIHIDGDASWLSLSKDKVLRFEGLTLGRAGSCHLRGRITAHQPLAQTVEIVSPSALLEYVGDTIPDVQSADLARLCGEVENSVQNDMLCQEYRYAWRDQLISERAQAYFLHDVRQRVMATNPTLLLEQWGTIGHPWHPNFKTKQGLSATEVVALSPEFQATIQVSIAAIRKQVTVVESSDPVDCDYLAWFAVTYPECFEHWRQALWALSLDPNDWYPLPIHPYQRKEYLLTEFAPEIERGDLRLLPVHLSASPTMSFRTVVPQRSQKMPHIKLPVSLRLTSVERTVSPKSAVMGPRITRLLNRLMASEKGFYGCLEIVQEEIGIHFLDADDQRARHLAALFRQNPAQKQCDGLFAIPVGALFAESPYADTSAQIRTRETQTLLAELVVLGYGQGEQASVAFFRRYAKTVLTATLGPYLCYGLAFEAHQQNSFILVDATFHPVRLLVRDFGDVRVHTPTLHAAGESLSAYRPGHTLFDDEVIVRDKILHAVMLCHLGEMVLLLERLAPQVGFSFWDLLRQEVILAFEHYRAQTEPHRWATEYEAFLEAPWPAKSFLRMRLLNTQDDLHLTMANPLARHIALLPQS